MRGEVIRASHHFAVLVMMFTQDMAGFAGVFGNLGGEGIGIVKLDLGAHELDQLYLQFLAVKVVGKIEEVSFQRLRLSIYGWSDAEIGYAVQPFLFIVILANDLAANGINPVLGME